MIRSIRRRVALSAFVSSTALLAMLGVTVYFGVRFALVRQLDRSLLEEIRLLAALVDFKGGEIDLGFEALDHAGAPQSEDAAYLQAWDSDGVELYRSLNLEQDLPRSFSQGIEPSFGWATSSTGRLRCVGVHFQPIVDLDADEEGDEATSVFPLVVPDVHLVLGRRDDRVTRILSDLLVLLVVSGALLSAGAVLLSLSLAREGLRPLRRFAEQIARIDDRSLDSRLDLARAPSEVAPVGERLNELLDRLAATIERERGFSADIAHELRTPLASLRSTVDVALRRPRDAESDREAFEDARQATRRLQALVDRLLWLVRLEAGAVEIDVQPTELAPLLAETWRPLEQNAMARRLRVEWNVPEGLQVASDPLLAGIVLRNLLENAVAYADEGGRIEVRAARNGDQAAIEVTNSGSKVDQEEVAGLLRRFTRGDQARTLVGSRCGLGLALVETITKALGHGVEIRTSRGGAFTVSLSMATAG
jgi:signal transduction histidine kinase